MNKIGKYRKTLNKRCPECGFNLQVRVISDRTFVKGNPIMIEEEHIVCSNPDCWYTEEGRNRDKSKHIEVLELEEEEF